MSAVNTGWVARNYNQRGLITHNFNHHNLVRTSSGILWAAIRENIQSKYIRIYRSMNGGFSWDLMWQGTFSAPGFRFTAVPGLNSNGPVMNLIIDERRNRLVLYHSMYNTSGVKFQIEPFIFLITGQDRLQRILPTALPAYSLIDINMDEMISNAVHNDDYSYVTYLSFSVLKLMKIRIDEPIVVTNAPNAPGSSFFNIHSTSVDDDNNLDVVILEDGGANYRLVHLRYSSAAGAWSAAHTISEFPSNDVFDLNLCRDGLGNLIAIWTQYLTGGTDLSIQYATSIDNGTTWSTVASIPKTAGHGNFTDVATGQIATRNSIIGLLNGGYIVTYVRSVSGVPTCFWRWIDVATGGTSYTLDIERQLAVNCTGAKFFNPTSTNLISGEDIANIRVGYTVGQGNSTIQVDTIPVAFLQKNLVDDYDLALDAYIEDAPGPNQLPVTFNIIGAPNDNVDYYAAGLVGTTTNKYLSAFQKIGTTIRLYRYEPSEFSYMNDKSSYELPTEFSIKGVFQPITYELPINTSPNELFTTYMERDTRKLYIPPDAHLARTWVLNQGQRLKRTVWTCAFDGNLYELSQVLPYFLDNEIAFYVANAYVIGASNDPFSREILPSET